MSSCIFDASDTENFPYEYRYANDSLVQRGTMLDGVCVFDVGYQCGIPGTSCCGTTAQVSDAASFGIYIMICFFGPYISLKLLGHLKPELFEKETVMSRLMEGKSQCYMYTLMAMFTVLVTATILEGSIMPKSIQQNLTPANRSAQLTISAFLTPIGEIFAFIEDTMTVKVGYAMALGQTSRLNALLHISTIGGVLSGVVAFLVMLVTALNDTSAGAILNPYAASNAALIEGGCALIPTTEELLKGGRTYWILLTAAWIPTFAVSGIVGFLIGTGEFMVFLVPGIVSAIVPITLWFTLLNASKAGTISLEPIEILGVAYGVDAWALSIFFLVFFWWRSDIRSKFKLRILWGGGSEGGGELGEEEDPDNEADSDVGTDTVSTWDVLIDAASEGLELMVVDLSVQLSKTVTIYVAASQGFQEVYKLATVDAAYWNFGPAYIVPMYTILKMMGAQLIANGRHREFIRFFIFFVVITLSLGSGAIVVAYWKQSPVAFEYGESACVYATSTGCSPIYKAIYEGANGLHSVFAAFGPTVLLNMLFSTLRQGLATCHDFSFLAKASAATFLIVFPPSILIARYYINTAVGYYVAMYLPHFVMVAVFGYRMVGHLYRMAGGEQGPWTQHCSTMTMRGASPPIRASAPPGFEPLPITSVLDSDPSSQSGAGDYALYEDARES